ncbi:MAG: tRNA pseudouridine(38-40) synthase TruA [Brachybacterium sp.]|nr:tRNA pseudouridine(38-40) synthase TruA [Brachybacterium sp.]
METPEMRATPTRMRLDLAYNGSGFHGWATQPGQRTVQGELEDALATILRAPIAVTVAGRTDAGVHARGQVAHLDVPAEAVRALPGRSDRTPADALVTRLAGVLPPDIVVRSARAVPLEFDARFGALRRRYAYRISDGAAQHDPMRADVLRHRRPLDVDAMAAASAALLGEHDFLSFCRPREGATTIRTLERLTWERRGPGRTDAGLIVADVRADAFCHHMVRSLVGAMLAVGEGRRPVTWPRELLAARTRRSAGRGEVGAAPMAPPLGLTLEEVEYPPEADLAAQSSRTRRVRTTDADGTADTHDDEETRDA